jgi:ribosomal protein S18 acetylase RimI-like enzyme
MSNIEVRRGGPGDGAIAEFFARERELSGYAAAALADKDAVIWLALDDGHLVGAVITRPMQSDDDGAQLGGVDELLVAGGRRSGGIGRLLMEAAEAHYRALGCAGMQLTVREDNEHARRLYESMGYGVVQRRLRMRKGFGG